MVDECSLKGWITLPCEDTEIGERIIIIGAGTQWRPRKWSSWPKTMKGLCRKYFKKKGRDELSANGNGEEGSRIQQLVLVELLEKNAAESHMGTRAEEVNLSS